MSSSDRTVKPRAGGGASNRGVAGGGGSRSSGTSRGTSRTAGSASGINKSTGASRSNTATKTGTDVSPGTQKVIQQATLKKQMERMRRNIEKERQRKSGLPSDADNASSKKVVTSRTKPSRIGEGARPRIDTGMQDRKTNLSRKSSNTSAESTPRASPKISSGIPKNSSGNLTREFLARKASATSAINTTVKSTAPKNYSGKSRINSQKPDLKQSDGSSVKGVPTKKAKIVNSTPKKSVSSTPVKTPSRQSSEELLSDTGKALSPISGSKDKSDQVVVKVHEAVSSDDDADHHQSRGSASGSPKKEKLTKQDRVNSGDQVKASLSNSDLDTDGDNILAAALARLGERSSQESVDQDHQKEKVSCYDS